MSEAGKPIYTRYGDEESLSDYFATISAIIHKMQSFFVEQAERVQSNRLKWICSDTFDCALVKKGSLVYICLICRKLCLNDGSEFLDEEYENRQINLLFGKQKSAVSST